MQLDFLGVKTMNIIVQILNKIAFIGLKQNLSLILSIFIHGVGISIIGISSVDIPDYQTNVLDVDFVSVQTQKRIISNPKKKFVTPRMDILKTTDLYRPNKHIQPSTVTNFIYKRDQIILGSTSMNKLQTCDIDNRFSSKHIPIQQREVVVPKRLSSTRFSFYRPEKQTKVDISEFDHYELTPLPLNIPDISEPTQNASFLKKVDPQYPESARLTHQEGLVVLEATIGIDGKATDIRVVKVINVNGLGCEESAIQALKASEFSPAMSGKVVVTQRLRIPYRFSLKI